MGQSFKKWTRPALLAGWGVLAGGCAAPATTAVPTAPVPPPPQRPSAPSRSGSAQPAPDASNSDKRFIIAPELSGILHVVSVSLANPSGAYLKIQVNVQNMTAAPQQFLYRIDWFDRDGGRLPLGADNFMPWMLLPGEVSSIAATAPVPIAVDFGIAFVPNVK